jgi:hypothetical protein
MDERYIRSGTMTDYNPDPGYEVPDYESRRDMRYSSRRSSAREYEAAGALDRDPRSDGYRDYGYRGGPRDYRGTRWSDGHRTTDYSGRHRDYDRDERGFLDRAGDEVRSWFGDDEAERRREMDRRRMRVQDDHYHQWRSSRMAELDRDYDEYRRENADRFNREFDSWRTERQGQRNSLNRIAENMEVVGSDGERIGAVDKIRGDRVILNRKDPDSGGHHHSFPSRWIGTVDDKVTLTKTAEEARNHWRDEERSGAMFGRDRDDEEGPHILGRSFSGTY